jgi:hypothetical protein
MDREFSMDLITVPNLHFDLATNGQVFRLLNVTAAGSNPALCIFVAFENNELLTNFVLFT